MMDNPEKKISSKDVQKIDQGLAFMAENMPPFWKRMYDGCVSSGFNDQQALELVKAYIMSANVKYN